MTAAELWQEYEQAKTEPDRIWPDDAGSLWRQWFQQSCKEGNDPSRLARHSLNLDEKIEARSIPGPDGCLFWDGPMSRWNTPLCHLPGSKVSVRRYLLTKDGSQAPARRRILSTCGHATCIQPKHLFWDEEQWGRLNNDEVIVRRLQVLALRLGHPPTSREWDASGLHPKRRAVSARFGGSWSGALRKAGLDDTPRRGPSRAFSDEELLGAIGEFRGKHGRPPTYGEAERELPMTAQGYSWRFKKPWTYVRDVLSTREPHQ